jgi:hypothetical protein
MPSASPIAAATKNNLRDKLIPFPPNVARTAMRSACLHRSNAKIFFQSLFMLITTQPCFFALSYSDEGNVPIPP